MPLTVKPSRRRATCPTSVGNCGKSRVENGKFLLLESVIFKKKRRALLVWKNLIMFFHLGGYYCRYSPPVQENMIEVYNLRCVLKN
jgi:hypothetical protein